MKNRKLKLNQLKRRMLSFPDAPPVPADGWIRTIRTGLNMTLNQLGKRLHITQQSVKEMEDREKAGTITLNTLRQAGEALGMRFVYGFIPDAKSLDAVIEKQAKKKAEEIVGRTSRNMLLEDQSVSREQLKLAIKEKMDELMKEMPGYLWD